jgi:soluble lytic murein transglycosylase-like protein
MSILSALKQQNSSIDSLAALPQAMIMQMAQRKEISEAMVAPILARKAELADAFARQNMLANASKAQPTVMEQLLAKNAQAEQPQMPEQMPQQVMPQEAAPSINPQAMPQGAEDVGIATQATQPMSMAGGGIVAFSKGDFIDEDDDEDAREEADYATMMNAALSGARNIPHKISELASRLPKSYADTKAQVSHEKAQKMGGHKYEDLVLAEAKRQGVDPKLALHVLYKETGGHKDPANAKSHAGALGPMQIMPRTAKDLGIDPSDPVQNIHGGVKYLAQLGSMFDNNPRLTAAAYNAGPGNVRKHGGVPNFKETQNYVVGLAHGGEVQHYASKGYVEDDEPTSAFERFFNQTDALKDYENKLAKQRDFERVTREQPGLFDKTTKTQRDKAAADLAAANQARVGIKTPAKVIPPTIPDELKNLPIASAPQEVRDNSVKVMPLPQGQAQAPVMPKSGLENFMEQMVAQKSELAKQRAEDKNMALLTAGLGMLGGTSQYAFENIGKGALAGVQNLGEARKSRAAEQNAIDRNMLYAHRYQGVEDVARQNAAAQQAYRGETLRETARANTNKELEHAQANLNNYLKMQMDLYKNRFPVEGMPGATEAMAEIYKRPEYVALAKRAGYTTNQPSTTFTPKQESLLSKYLPR